MPYHESIAISLFVIGAISAGIIPRYKWDKHDCIGGGTLSYRFRLACFVLAVENVIRNVFMTDKKSNPDVNINDSNEVLLAFIYWFLKVFEAFGIGFLMMLSPYFLQCHLATMVRIKPGHNLVPWLYWIMLFQVMGVIGSLFHPKYYAIKKVGDALSCIPILRTLAIYQHVLSGQDSRVITIQTVQMVERCSLFLLILSSIGYSLVDREVFPTFFHAVQVTAGYMVWTRVSFHALLLNLMDEAMNLKQQEMTPSTNSSDPDNSESTFVEEINQHETQLVGRVKE
jgi:hypothetical protein